MRRSPEIYLNIARVLPEKYPGIAKYNTLVHSNSKYSGIGQ